eukprot:m.341324 g.341324  ORF g.341324 m.341324 type:complete len:210 (+) comp20008_c0_seq1:296-925(+)
MGAVKKKASKKETKNKSKSNDKDDNNVSEMGEEIEKKKKGKKRTAKETNEQDESDEQDEGPAEMSFAAAAEEAANNLPVQTNKKKRRKNRKERVMLDDDLLESVANELENRTDDAEELVSQEFQGTKTKLDEDDNEDDQVKDSRKIGHILEVRRTQASSMSNLGRNPADSVQSFLKSHFYGDRLNRVQVTAARSKSRSRPSRNFATQKF